MYKEQKPYLWTVLLRVFKNSLGRIFINKFKETRDARAAYIEHGRLQTTSSAKVYGKSEYLRNLQSLRIDEHTGTRTEYIT